MAQEYLIAYLDILGFSDLVENANTRKAKKNIEDMLNLVQGISEQFNKKRIKNCYINLKVLAISDTIIISTPYKDKNIRFLFAAVSALAYQLVFFNKLLLRGGVAKGELKHQGNLIYGKAYLRACKLEKEAIYPRIIVDKNLIEDLYNKKILEKHNFGISAFSEPSSLWIEHDNDSNYFIDFLCDSFFRGGTNDTERNLSLSLTEFCIKNFKKFIQENKTKYAENKFILAKYDWLENYFNSNAEPFLKMQQELS
jgi:hypothetical protein